MLRLPAFLSSRHLVFDDGVYGVSVVDMRHGLAPYRGVFSAQGPLHFSLLYLGDLLGFRTIDGPRVAPMLAGIAATIAAWAIARRLAGSTAGLIAGVLVATSGSMIWTTGQVTGDGLASAIAVSAVWAAVVYRDDPRLRRALRHRRRDGRRHRGEAADPAGRDPRGLVAVVAAPHRPSRRPRSAPRSRCGSLPRCRGASATCGTSRSRTTAAPGPATRRLAQLRKLFSTLTSRDLLVFGALVLALVALIVIAVAGRAVARLAVRERSRHGAATSR